MGVARIDALTPDQSARIDEWTDRWIAVGLRTGPADRERFEAAMRDCYGFAWLEGPGAGVWGSSPLLLAVDPPGASRAIAARETDRGIDAGESVADAVPTAVGTAIE